MNENEGTVDVPRVESWRLISGHYESLTVDSKRKKSWNWIIETILDS